MDPITTAALVSGGANVLGNLFNVFGQSKANEANMKLAEYQYEKNLEMWNRQNDYNLPINQMARLRQAGINPVMAFSGGQVSGNVVQSTPDYKAPQLSPYQVDSSGLASIGSQYIQARQAEKQMKLMESQTSLNEAKVATENMVALLRELQGSNQFMQNQYFQEVAPILKEVLEKNRDLLSSHKKYYDATTTMTESELSLVPIRAQHLLSQISTLSAQQRHLAVQDAKTAAETFILNIQKEYVRDFKEKDYEVLNQQLENLRKIGDLRDLEKFMKEFNNSKLDFRFKMEVLLKFIQGASSLMGAGSDLLPLIVP